MKIAVFICLFLSMFILNGCFNAVSISTKPYKETQFLMDTILEITAYGSNKEDAVNRAFNEFRHIDKISNRFNPDSQLSKINELAGISPVQVDSELIEIVQRAIEISELTQGAFDITIGPLTSLWNVGHKVDFIPSQAEIDKVLPLIDYRKIHIDIKNKTIFLPEKGMLLDLGGVAKDYAVNKAITVLKAQGIKSALINAGGDIQVIGTRPDSKPWRIGVQDPRNPEGVSAIVSLTEWDMLQTSGDYQRYFMKDGIRYSHILSPKTGWQPKGVVSVTLVYSTSTRSAIASSGFMVLGVEKGLAILQNIPGVEAIFVTSEGKIITTPGLKDKLQ